MEAEPAHTLPELTTENKLISGHSLDVMMQGRNWDYYAQVNESRPQQQPEQNGDHLSECQEGVLTKHPDIGIGQCKNWRSLIMHLRQVNSLAKHKLSHTKPIRHNNNFTASTTTEPMERGLSRGPHPYNQNDMPRHSPHPA